MLIEHYCKCYIHTIVPQLIDKNIKAQSKQLPMTQSMEVV